MTTNLPPRSALKQMRALLADSGFQVAAQPTAGGFEAYVGRAGVVVVATPAAANKFRGQLPDRFGRTLVSISDPLIKPGAIPGIVEDLDLL